MPMSTPHIREATHTHYEIAQSHTHKHTVRRPATHTHTWSSDQPHTHTHSGRAPRTIRTTNTTLFIESTQLHTILNKIHNTANTLMPKRNKSEF